MKLKSLRIAACLAGMLLAGAGLAIAASTINPSVPARNSPMASAPIRANFQAAYNDITNILGHYAAPSAPSNPIRYQDWLDNSTSLPVLKMYDGSVWVPMGQLDPLNHAWSLLAPTATARGGVLTTITAGSVGGAGAVPIITYNANGQITSVTTATPTVTSVNGVLFPASPSTNTVPVVTSSNTVTYEAVPNAALANSAITIGGNSTSLGGTVTASQILDQVGTTRGSLLYRGAATWGALTPGTSGLPLLSSGTGADPAYGALTLSGSAVSGILGSANGGTNNGFTAFSGPATSTKTFTLPNASATILTTNAAVTVPQGGTGQASFTAHGLILGNGSSALNVTAVGTNGQLLIGQTGADPSWASMSGDCSLSSAGAITCTKTNGSNFVATATSTDAANLTGTLAAARLPSFGSGDVSFASGGGAGTIAANAVTNAKAAQMAANTIKGNNTGSTANAADLTPAQANVVLGNFNSLTNSKTTTTGTLTSIFTATISGSNGAIWIKLHVNSDYGGAIPGYASEYADWLIGIQYTGSTVTLMTGPASSNVTAFSTSSGTAAITTAISVSISGQVVTIKGTPTATGSCACSGPVIQYQAQVLSGSAAALAAL